MRFFIKFLQIAFLSNIITCEKKFEIDPNGYIVFCPCMGRLGNQIDQFLGALSFAKGVDRTLVLPHLIEYPPGASPPSAQIPFQTYFKPEPLAEYTKVILMDDFMKHIAPVVWPKGTRTVFCYGPRGDKTCNAKDGNPFGPYWNKFDIDFDVDEFYGPLSYDTRFEKDIEEWNVKYSAKKYPVLAFTGAPGAFPVSEENTHLQKYLKWSDEIEKKANEFIETFKENKDDKFIALHLRNGIDFKNACEHAKTAKMNFFASAQCLGYRMENGQLTEELCAPSENTIMKQLDKAIKKSKATAVYVATDDKDMISKFQKRFKNVKFVKYPSNNPHVDLCILSKADHAILNCISTFSAFAKRQRDSEGKTTEFWAFNFTDNGKKHDDNEL